ncbi:deoxyribodipyrimidine photo-lyase [Pedobacter sp. P351]|uniref:cryptochrome/photolyase family protein n=1 Tax=Pedobacter superstes TaxID=3133441 RepID=UPI0030A23170
MDKKPVVNIFWFRRDLRLQDNAGLYYALRSGVPVLPLFIFDRNILDKLEDKNDARVTFIHQALSELNCTLKTYHSSVLVKYSSPSDAFKELLKQFNVQEVFTNNDYEPYARKRDSDVASILEKHEIKFNRFKDHVIFEKSEIVKDDSSPYTVFTAYKRKWVQSLQAGFHFKPYPTLKYFHNFLNLPGLKIPELSEIGFKRSLIDIPSATYLPKLGSYADLRDYPAIDGTSRIGIHLRFGTISIREVAADGSQLSSVWLNELIWRDFYSMILWHFPETETHAFKKEFDTINWRNDEQEFAAWCEGKTGYPIVDAGMRQLNATGWMHNRVRMIVASFLCKHLLIDWRWGEAYFARKLLDYDMASNVGGWQWAAGTGNDAAPYFRVFSPDLQTKKFDPQLNYIKKWIPEFEDPFLYPKPIVEHKFARERALKAYKLVRHPA